MASIAGIGLVPVDLGGRSDAISGIAADATGLQDNVIVHDDVRLARRADLGPGRWSATAFAKDHGLAVGSPLTAASGRCPATDSRSAASSRDNQVLNDPAMIIPRALYERATPVAQQGDFLVYVKARPGATWRSCGHAWSTP